MCILIWIYTVVKRGYKTKLTVFKFCRISLFLKDPFFQTIEFWKKMCSVHFEGLNGYGKCPKTSNTLLFLFWNKMLVIRAGIHKMLVRIAIREDQGTNIFQYCTCPAGRVTYNFHSSCKYMHLCFKSVCNKEDKGVICIMTSSSNSSQSTCPVGRVLWEELLVLSRFQS